MSAAKKTSKKSSSAKKTTRKRATAAGSKKATARKTTGRSTDKKTVATKASAKKTAAKTAAKKTPARKTPTKKAPTRSSASRAAAATATRTARAPRPAKLDKKTLQGIRATLEAQRKDLLQRQAELEQDSFDATQSDLTGEVGLDEDFADAGTATFERERDLSIRNNIRDLIDQITRAMGRIDDGTYGTCERCGRPIDAARLRALPHALLCMDCKRREERAR
jgi:RNA polymerase-binding protein DksA